MTNKRNIEIIGLMRELLTELESNVEKSEVTVPSKKAETTEDRPSKVEVLTIKECSDVIQGLSEHTVRQLIKQGKLKSFRAGVGARGKQLIKKDDLLSYFGM